MTQEPATGDYEVDRQRHVRAMTARLPGEVDKMTWPLERLHALRDERLRALIRLAKERSPWHARRLRHIDPDKLCGADLTAIPPMTKDDLMDHWDEIVTDRRLTLAIANDHLARVAERGSAYLLDEYHVITSGGTSGKRGVFAWDFDGWLACELAARRGDFWLAQQNRLSGARRFAVVMASHPIHVSAAMSRTFAGGVRASFANIPVSLPLNEIIGALNTFEPAQVAVYPSILHHLALHARAGELRIRPEMIICSGEPLLPETRAAAEEAFGALLLNYYGNSELGLTARSFPGSPGMHLVEDIAVYEPVDVRGAPVPAGERAAKLLITNVVNALLPLIRYELTDEVTFLAEPNPGPWNGRRIADVQGRLDDTFVYPGGLVVHPHTFWSVLGRAAGIAEYQVRQTPRGAEIIVRTAGPIDIDAIRRELHGSLLRLGLPDPQISLTIEAALERLPGTGKLKRFFPLAKGDPAA